MWLRSLALASLACAAMSCNSAERCAEPATTATAATRAEQEPAPRSSVVAPSAGPTAGPTGRAPSAPVAGDEASTTEVPSGYVAVHVMTVSEAPNGGAAVLLAPEDEKTVLPIFVGGTEALSISLRLSKEAYARPLTHDLLDQVVKDLGASVVKVHITELRGTIFIGAVFLKKGSETLRLDARPSDAIALALGNGVPIFVAKDVLTTAGISRDEIDRAKRNPPRDPMSL